MARIRTIKPEFWEDETIGSLSHGARLLFLACLNLADDEGLLRWNEMFLGSSVFAYDDIKVDTVKKWMKEIEDLKLIFIYNRSHGKQVLGWIVNFLRHQRIDKPQPSKFPTPSIQSHDVKYTYGMRDKMVCQICFGEIDMQSPSNICGSKYLSLDHIKFKVNGGNDYPSNIRAVHVGCNKSRQNNDNHDVTDYAGRHRMNDNNHSENGSENGSTPEWKGKEIEKESNGGEQKASPPPPTKEEVIKTKKEEFTKSLQPYVETYGKDMMNKFFQHWAEPNKSMTKLKWELQATWELKLRLAKWDGNEDRFKK